MLRYSAVKLPRLVPDSYIREQLEACDDFDSESETSDSTSDSDSKSNSEREKQTIPISIEDKTPSKTSSVESFKTLPFVVPRFKKILLRRKGYNAYCEWNLPRFITSIVNEAKKICSQTSLKSRIRYQLISKTRILDLDAFYALACEFEKFVRLCAGKSSILTCDDIIREINTICNKFDSFSLFKEFASIKDKQKERDSAGVKITYLDMQVGLKKCEWALATIEANRIIFSHQTELFEAIKKQIIDLQTLIKTKKQTFKKSGTLSNIALKEEIIFLLSEYKYLQELKEKMEKRAKEQLSDEKWRVQEEEKLLTYEKYFEHTKNIGKLLNKEKRRLEKKLGKTTDPEKKEKIKHKLSETENQLKSLAPSTAVALSNFGIHAGSGFSAQAAASSVQSTQPDDPDSHVSGLKK